MGTEINNLAEYVAARGGHVAAYPQAGEAARESNLMAQHCAVEGQELPVAKQDQSFQALVKAAPEMKMG